MNGMTGMMFGGEGPVMQGTWYNPQTGDAFTVRDSFFEDNQYVVTTTDGRYLRYDQIQSYIQSDMKLEDLKQMKVERTVKEEPLPAEIAGLIADDDYSSMLLPEDAAIMQQKTPIGNIYSQVPTTAPGKYTSVQQSPASASASMNEAIIEKALKNAPKPEIVASIAWENFPERQIDMLREVMEIPDDEIAEWYLNNIELMDVIDAIKEAIKYKILCKEGEALQKKIIRQVAEAKSENVVEPKKTRKKKA